MARKQALSAQEVQELEVAESVRDVFRHAGRALCFTIMAAEYPPGGPREDELLKACDDAWSSLADKVLNFAKEN
jgi:hypothetical protein